jgi:diguanylate cyclase (GGDEF)-like protein
MEKDIFKLLGVINGVFFVCDKSKQIINALYSKEKVLSTNCSFDESLDAFCNYYNLDRKDLPLRKVLSFYETLQNDNKTNIINFKTNDNDDHKFRVTAMDYENNVTCFLLESISKNDQTFAIKDPLTGAYTKNFVPQLIKIELTKPNPKPFIFFILDIDNFKQINDNLGHMFGDEVLKFVANLLNDEFKDGYVARIGGDEFVVFAYMDVEYQNVWNKLHDIQLKASHFKTNNNEYQDITFTIGCIRYPDDGSDYEGLFTKADKALYRGKKKGKNCFIIYNDKMHKDIMVVPNGKNILSGTIYSRFLVAIFDILSQNAPFKDNLQTVLPVIAEYFGSDRISLYLEDKTSHDLKFEFGWASIEPNANLKYVIPRVKNYLDLWKPFMIKNYVKISKVIALEKTNPELFQILKAEKTKSVMNFFFEINGHISGMLRIDSVNKSRDWTLEESEIFRIIGRILSIFTYKMTKASEMDEKLYYDSLTGLNNYTNFINKGRNILMTSSKQFVIYMFNLNRFRVLNDTYGFEFGDRVLYNFASLLSTVYCDSQSVIGRSSMDRFIVLEPFKSFEEANKKFKMLDQMVKHLKFDHQIECPINCGAYVTDGKESNISELIDKANIARKNNKNNVKSCLVFYDERLGKKYKDKQVIELHFREALKNNEFEVYLQPKIDSRTNKLIGAEALSRWNFNFSKLLEPDSYIPYLEKSKAICDLDLFMFEEVCKMLKKFKDNSYPLFPISLNVSKHHQIFLEYVKQIELIRKRYDVNPNLLEIEITENMFSEEKNIELNDVLDKLKKIGYKISLDSFGKGYSNLELLSETDFDSIKIDKSLFGTGKKKELILNAVLNMIASLNIPIIFEGVENEEELSSLNDKGCYLIQGFVYDKPMNIKDFEKKYLKIK